MTSKLERAVLAGGCFWGMQDQYFSLICCVGNRIQSGPSPQAKPSLFLIQFGPDAVLYRLPAKTRGSDRR